MRYSGRRGRGCASRARRSPWRSSSDSRSNLARTLYHVPRDTRALWQSKLALMNHGVGQVMGHGERQERSEERNLYSVYMRPAVEFITHFAELLLLAVIFRIAGERTNSLVIDILGYALTFALMMQVGLVLGLTVYRPLGFVKVKRLTIPLLIGLAVAGGLVAWLIQVLVGEVNAAANQMIDSGTGI